MWTVKASSETELRGLRLHTVRRFLAVSLVAGWVLAASLSLNAQERTPATPLITHDPYFSVWSTSDKLTGSNTQHWTGSPQPIDGLARIDGKPFRFMGRDPRDVPAMEQISCVIAPTHTSYAFRAGGVLLDVVFLHRRF